MSILILADHSHDEISPYTLSTLSAAQQIAGHNGDCPIDILICGHNASGAASKVAEISGIRAVYHADHADFAEGLAESIAAPLVQLVKNNGYNYVLTSASSTGKNVMPRAAALMDSQQISDIIAVNSADTFIRPIYAGNALATVQSSDVIKFITVRATAFDAADAGGGSAPIETIDASINNDLSKFVKKEVSKSERPELGTASVVVSGGRALGSAENFALIEQLADKLGGAIGASRAAVDAGYVANDLQVGQTGKVVAPQLYIAIGISGAIQHLAGMKDSKVIVAINKDPDAPIFTVADYGLVGDLFDIVPELMEKV